VDSIALVEAPLEESQAEWGLKAKLEQAGFGVIVCDGVESCLNVIEQQQCKLVVIDDHIKSPSPQNIVQAIRDLDEDADMPVVLMGTDDHLNKRIESAEAGFDDYFLVSMSIEALQNRFQRLAFNKVANDQLKSQLQEARGMVFSAMSNTSDLGVNIQFMLDSHHCENLDELGMLLFQTLQHYGVVGSLQMRSQYGLKNMEANGMAKHLESTLLWELKDRGRYVDFGRRSVMNYENVSLLVKNMPKDEPVRYGALKDNLFSLLQGVDARIAAIDNIKSLKLEKQLVCLMTSRIQQLMEGMDESYQSIMKDIATVVEDMSERIHDVITVCALHEDQEMALERIIEQAVVETNDVFSKFIMSDGKMKESMRSIQQSFSSQQEELTPTQMIKMIKEFKDMDDDVSKVA
jgi:DNA-binding response OmpR family regulator